MNPYTTAAQRDKEQLLHTKSLQLPENKGLQTFRKTVECIVTVPSVSFETQVNENNKEIKLKKLSTEIIMGKTTEDTAMELDAEGGASFEQLQDLIKKNVINGIRNIALWNKNTTNYRTHSITHNRKKLTNKGPTRRLQQKEIPRCKSSTGPKPTWPPNNNNKTAATLGSSSIHYRTARKSRRYQQRYYKRQSHKIKREQAITITSEEKNFYQRSEQAATAITSKIKQQFGFVADPKKTLLHNASSTLATTPTWYYFARPSHLAFHDFTQQKQPAKNLRSLLGLGLKFIPTPRCTNTWTKLKETSMPKLQRAIHLRFHFAGSETSSNDTYDPKIYVRSNWTPPYWTLPPIVLQQRLDKFATTLNKLFKRRMGKTNLLSYQTRALQSLQKQQDFLICSCDKNLGPAIIERDDYIKITMRDHLLDGRTYRRLSEADCNNHKQRLIQEIKSWLKQYNKTLTKMERAFLKQGLDQNKRAFAGFYLTLKAHKLKPGQNITHLKSRPIVSCPGSLLHPLGIWTDRKLQSLAKQQISYFRNSFDLRQELCSTQYPTTAQLFTADAVSMYTNIPTNTAIMLIARHLHKKIPEERPKQNEALIAALKLVMLNNIFSFGDMTFKQLNGTAMGTLPTPPYAMIYYGLHESTLLPNHRQHVIFYKRFIDDVFGIWLPHPNPEIYE